MLEYQPRKHLQQHSLQLNQPCPSHTINLCVVPIDDLSNKGNIVLVKVWVSR